jgi:hypothetical protein
MRPLFSLLLAAAAFGNEIPLSELAHRAVMKYIEGSNVTAEYDYESWSRERKLASDGTVKEDQSARYRVTWRDGFRVSYQVEQNGQPVSAEQMKKQEAQVEKRLAELRRIPPAEMAKRRAESAKKRAERLEFLKEFPNAFDFRIVERTTLNQRPVSVVEFTPKPGYRPSSMRAKLFTKIRGKVWMDREELQMVRLEAEAFDDISIGGFLANVGKGTFFKITQQRLDANIYVPETRHIRYAARLMLVKSMHEEEEERFWGYQRRTPLAATRTLE